MASLELGHVSKLEPETWSLLGGEQDLKRLGRLEDSGLPRWYFRELDPAEADIYVDALLAPLVFKYERFTKEKRSSFRLSDYALVSLFLLVNMALQLAIAFKIDQVALRTYGEVGEALFHGACWSLVTAFFPLVSCQESRGSTEFHWIALLRAGQDLGGLRLHGAAADLGHAPRAAGPQQGRLLECGGGERGGVGLAQAGRLGRVTALSTRVRTESR